MTFTQFLAVLRARRRLVLGVFFGTILFALVLSLVLPKKYTGSASVVVQMRPDPISSVVYGTSVDPSLMATQLDIVNSDRVARRVIRNLHLDQNPQIRAQWQSETDGEGTIEDWLTDFFQQHLDVKPGKDSNVITINYKAPDPKFAAAIANAFAQAYLDTSVELRTDPAKQYSDFFQARIKQARDALLTAQTKLSDFQRDRGIVGSDERLDVESEKLSELSNQLVLAQAMAAESQSRQAQAAHGRGDSLSESLNNPVVAGLRADLSRAEASLEELNSRLGANHPQVQQAKANIAELRRRIQAETSHVAGSVGVSASIDQARLAEIKAQVEAQRQKVLKLKQDRDQMSVYQRDVENAQRNYDAIAARSNESSLESQTQQSNVSILSPATPPVLPSSPKLVLNLIISVILGGLLAVGSAMLREITDRRIRSSRDLVEHLGLPVLGVLPRPMRVRGKRAPKLSLMAERVISGRLPSPKAD
jgi:chain length determinant protein EpsF